jgi:NADPH2:quinone reductase
MHAIRLHDFGPPENLRYEQIGDLLPEPDQARILVAASGVYLLDTSLRRGVACGPMPLPALPTIPGRFELADAAAAHAALEGRATMGKAVLLV